MPCFSQVNVITQHNDQYRTGWNNLESQLNVSNVNSQQFGKIFTRLVDDQIWGQPLIVTALPINGVPRNVVFVTTVNNSVYAFDADSAGNSTPFWQVNLTEAGKRPVLYTDMTGACGGGYNNFLGNIGIVGTPVIDTSAKTIHLVARSVNQNGTSGYSQYLHALDIRTGAEKANSPVLITAQVPGTGDGSSNGMVSFDPQKNNQRPGLLLLNGVVYIGFSSHCDWPPYHGWLLGYDATTLTQKSVYITTPNGSDGGIWMSGMAPAADELGNIYLASGNGTNDGLLSNPNPVNSGNSMVKLTPTGNTLPITSYFTPYNYDYLNNNDLDVGVVQVLLIPQTKIAISGDKNGELFVVNRDAMGGFNPSSNNIIQLLPLTENSNLHASLAYYIGNGGEKLYTWSENTALTAFAFNRTNGSFDLNHTITGPTGPYGQSGAFLSVSSNGSDDSTAILWASHPASGDAESSTDPGILRAFVAADPTREIWNSSMDPNDQPGSYSKFSCPTIANGKVYLSTFSNQLVVYGLVDKSADTCNTANIALNKPAYASSLENNAQFSASDAFDGSLATRWSSQFSDPQYIYVDLGQPYHICNVVLKWEFAYGKDFSIQVSDDAQNWTTVQSISGNTQMINLLPLNANGRYVRMYGTARGTAYGYSLYEFEVYGNPLIKNNSTAPIIYPNPAQSYLHILKGTEDIQEISISNAAGQLIVHTVNVGNQAQVDIPMAGFAKAIYFVRVQTGVKSYQYKVLHVN